MRYQYKAVGAGLALGFLVVTHVVWQRERARRTPAPASPVANVASAESAEACDSNTEACGAHAQKGAKAAAKVEGRPRMLVFSSASCPACERMRPRVDTAVKACAGENDVARVDVDADEGEALAATYGVSLLPSFVSIDSSGNEVSRLTGVQSEDRLERAIEEIRAVRCAMAEGNTPAEKPM